MITKSVGHTWVKRLFIDCKYSGIGNEKAENFSFIPCTVYENEYIMKNDPSYVETLEALPEKEKQAMLYGDWNVFEGQFFDEFNEDVHVFDDDVKIEQSWRHYRARDYGLDMLDCLWFAIDEYDTMWVYRELAQPGLTVVKSGKAINALTKPHEEPYLDICPPDMWNKNGQTGRNAVDFLIKECGQRPTKANNDRVIGWLMVKERLQVNSITGRPKVMIHKSCENLIYSMKMIQFDEKNPNDCAKNPHDLTHACVVGNTMVCTTEGWREIKDLVGKTGKLYSYNCETKEVEIQPYHNVCMTKKDAEILRISLEDGRFIECTEDHPILTQRGYIKAGELTNEDEIVEVDLCKL